MRWYVVHAYSGYEKKVAAALQDRVALHGMEDRILATSWFLLKKW